MSINNDFLHPAGLEALEHKTGGVTDGYLIAISGTQSQVCTIWFNNHTDCKLIADHCRKNAEAIAAVPEMINAFKALLLCEFGGTEGGYNRRSAKLLGLEAEYAEMGNTGFKAWVRATAQEKLENILGQSLMEHLKNEAKSE